MNKSLHTAIRFHDIHLTIDSQEIIKGISGSIPNGKITTFIGPSGAGKTTLLKMCNRLISQTVGDIYIYERNIAHYDPILLRQRVGIALQSAPMIKGTVYDNLNLPKSLQQKKLAKIEAFSILEDVGLDKMFLEKDVSELSGGEKQRVSIARTLLNKNEILLLDEITSALDYTSSKEMEQLIVHINKKYAVTIVWITHNLQQAIQLSDYIWLLVDGTLIEAATPDDLMTSTHPTVQQFLSGGMA